MKLRHRLADLAFYSWLLCDCDCCWLLDGLLF